MAHKVVTAPRNGQFASLLMSNSKHSYKLKLRVGPGDLLDKRFPTQEEAEEYAERIFLLHSDESWRDTFDVLWVEGK